MKGWSAFTKKTDKVVTTAAETANIPAQTGAAEAAAKRVARKNKREDMKGAPDVATTKPRKQPEAAQDREKTPPYRTAKPTGGDSPAEDKSPMTKNGDDGKKKTASTIYGQEIKKDGKGNYKIGTDYGVSGVGKVITDPKGILKKHTKDGNIEDLDFTYTTKGDTTSVTGIKSPMKKKKSPYYIAEEGDIQADMAPINLKAKDNRKKISKSEQRTAKLKHGKDSEEYKQAKDKTKKLQTGREKIRTKMQEKKDKRTRKKNINKTKKDKIKQTKAEAKFLKNNPNIPMP